jgi:hypothetical protein
MSDKSFRVTNIITSIILIWIIVKIIAFVETMPQCGCSVPQQTLDRIAFLEKVIIAIMSGSILYNLYLFNDPIVLSKTNNSGSILLFSSHQLLMFFAFAVYLMFTLNAKDFSKTLNKSCDCADKWEKTALYIQGIFYAIAVALIIFIALALLTFGTIKMSSSFEKVAFLFTFSIVAISAWSLFGGDLNVFLDYVMETVETEGFQSGRTCGCDKEQKKWL